MSKRKKHNHANRLKSACKGLQIKSDGKEYDVFNALGLPVDDMQVVKNVASLAWRWCIEVSFIFKHNELTKTIVETIPVHQQKRLNELYDVILEKQTMAALELGDYWQFKTKKWKAKIL